MKLTPGLVQTENCRLLLGAKSLILTNIDASSDVVHNRVGISMLSEIIAAVMS